MVSLQTSYGYFAFDRAEKTRNGRHEDKKKVFYATNYNETSLNQMTKKLYWFVGLQITVGTLTKNKITLELC